MINELRLVFPRAIPIWLEAVISILTVFELNTKLRKCSFLAQLGHESNGFTTFAENLNYSAETLRRVLGNHFTAEEALSYAHQPIRIANRAYANRLGNGDENSGDGWRYRGRGPIQLTGKNNYRAYGEKLSLNLLSDPDLLLVPLTGCRAAGHFWQVHNLNAYADRDDQLGITHVINGGTNGLEQRLEYLHRLEEVINA
jgi:putative chitinase